MLNKVGTTLADAWNAYDGLMVDGPEPLGLSSAEVRELTTLAEDVEHRKFAVEQAGSLLGANLWHEIGQLMVSQACALDAGGVGLKCSNAKGNSQGTSRANSIVAYSGHYPTLLGLFSSFDLRNLNAPLLDPLPRYAAALFLEVHRQPTAETGFT